MNALTKKLTSRALRSILLGAAFALALLPPIQARAADNYEEAHALYVKGSAALKAGDEVMARHYFGQSLALRESFDTYCALGRAEARSKLFPEAYEHLRMCIALFPDTEELQAVRGNYAKLRDNVRAELRYEEAQPIDERVDAEIRRREAVANGQTDDDGGLPASGLDEHESTPGSEVASAPRRNWIPAYVLGGVTVATFGTSMVFRSLVGKERKKIEALSEDLDDSSNSYCVDPENPGCSELQRRLERHDDYARVSDGTLIAAGVGAAATLGYVIYVLAKKPTKESPVQASLSVQKTGGFVSLAGTF